MPIHVEIVTQERKVFDEPEADMIIIPAAEGEMGVLPHHAPVLTTLGFGELVVRKGQREERFAIYGGVVDVRPDKVVVLADLAESSFALDLERIEAARESARRMLAEGVPEAENREAVLALRRAELGLRIHRKLQTRGPVMRILEEDNE
ncbi:MAG TPA: ATP synthase F1 subunit epsilon [Spirillospora sp.]|nr:ATP synthase F1 subunit epsilon [Spirillospora sp.]